MRSFNKSTQGIAVFNRSNKKNGISALLTAPSTENLFRGTVMRDKSVLHAVRRGCSHHVNDTIVRRLNLGTSRVSRLYGVPCSGILTTNSGTVTGIHTRTRGRKISSFVFN